MDGFWTVWKTLCVITHLRVMTMALGLWTQLRQIFGRRTTSQQTIVICVNGIQSLSWRSFPLEQKGCFLAASKHAIQGAMRRVFHHGSDGLGSSKATC